MRQNPAAQRQRLAEGLCELVPARQSVVMQFHRFHPRQQPELKWAATGGTPSAAEQAVFEAWAAQGRFSDDPMLQACMRRRRRPVYIATRREMVDDADWFASDFYEQCVRPSGLDDAIGGFFRRLQPHQYNGLTLQRGSGDGPFSLRERRMVQLLNAEMGRLHRQRTFDPPQPRLPARQQQILELLGGESVKRIASRSGLSRRTVEEYVQAIYRRFGVATRPELMALFIEAPPLRSPAEARLRDLVQPWRRGGRCGGNPPKR